MPLLNSRETPIQIPMNLVPTSGTFPVNTPLLESGQNLCDGVLHRQKVYMKSFTPEFKAKKSPFLNRSENVWIVPKFGHNVVEYAYITQFVKKEMFYVHHYPL